MARSRKSRASSTPRLDAASISTTSRLDDPLQMRWHEMHSPHGSPSSRLFSQLSAIARTRASVVLPTPRGPQSRYPCATRPLAMAPRSVFDTCDWTATSAKLFGRYLRASARDIARREYPRPDGATLDTACRCYLRGPDGVSGLTPSGTWGNPNIASGRRRGELTGNLPRERAQGIQVVSDKSLVGQLSVVASEAPPNRKPRHF